MMALNRRCMIHSSFTNQAVLVTTLPSGSLITGCRWLFIRFCGRFRNGIYFFLNRSVRLLQKLLLLTLTRSSKYGNYPKMDTGCSDLDDIYNYTALALWTQDFRCYPPSMYTNLIESLGFFILASSGGRYFSNSYILKINILSQNSIG